MLPNRRGTVRLRPSGLSTSASHSGILQFVALQARPKALPFRTTVCRRSRGPIVCRKDRSSVTQLTLQSFSGQTPVDCRKWTSHSIRIGACNSLFGTNHVIKFRLRWKSMTFMNYFRNLGAISAAQNAAVQKAIEQPELFY
jgi:hypothetical protein